MLPAPSRVATAPSEASPGRSRREESAQGTPGPQGRGRPSWGALGEQEGGGVWRAQRAGGGPGQAAGLLGPPWLCPPPPMLQNQLGCLGRKRPLEPTGKQGPQPRVPAILPSDEAGPSYPIRVRFSWGSQGKNTRVLCHSLLQWTAFCQAPTSKDVSSSRSTWACLAPWVSRCWSSLSQETSPAAPEIGAQVLLESLCLWVAVSLACTACASQGCSLRP